jgi:hypothetical protein
MVHAKLPPNAKSGRSGGGVTAEEMRETQSKPATVVQVTREVRGRLRHGAFVGVRPTSPRRTTAGPAPIFPGRPRMEPGLYRRIGYRREYAAPSSIA